MESDSLQNELSLEDFQLFSYKALVTFLSLRGKSVDGQYDVLVARAFAAYEEGVPVDHEREH